MSGDEPPRKALVDMTPTEVIEFIHGEYSGRMHLIDWNDVGTREDLILRFGMLMGLGARLAQENAELRRRLAIAQGRQ